MEHHGHHITGMSQQIVWGLPHVFAIFLIVAASGALNISSMSSVFNRTHYKPLSRLSAMLSICLLAGGLAVLVLDLGRPDRLIVAMTHYNFKSIFAWNIILYNGFFAIVFVYIWMMMEQKMNKFSKLAGFFAFLWRLILTTGTGSIFGFLFAREAYDAAIMGPMFVIMSFSFGLAFFMLVMGLLYKLDGRQIGDYVFNKLRKLLGVFIAAVLYFVIVKHLTNLYAAEHTDMEYFMLFGDNIYTQLFWYGQVLLGGLLPLIMLYGPLCKKSRLTGYLAAFLVVLGGLIQIYVIVIGGQAYPLVLFPGMEVTSSFFDGTINSYIPSKYEIALGVSGVAITLLAIVFASRILPVAADNLSDEYVNPHFKKK
ncbi:MAG: molybdopterin oxidoreductase [Gammaproteobacteria bacterium]|nr:MAG: molybdopterin oxidoreductase [Gammaproteobacteria bacterium]